MGPYCKELEEDFQNLAESLAPSNEYLKEMAKIQTLIFENLKQEGPSRGIKIGRTITAGSIGHGTAICFENADGEVYPDLDLVVFVNYRKPPFREVYEAFEDILSEVDEVSDIRLTKFSIQFKVESSSFGDINVDLLAAENHVPNTKPWSNCDVGMVQAEIATLDLDEKQKKAIKSTKNVSQAENKLDSSSLAEKTVKIMREFVDDEFNLDIVRFAKRWVASIDLKKHGYVPAKSIVIAIIAIYAQETRRSKRNGKERCIISGFRRFLEAISNFRTLDISLDEDAGSAGLKYCSKPMIMDPGNNKWNNLAEGFPVGAIRDLEEQAKETLKMLERFKNSSGYTENAIHLIFLHNNCKNVETSSISFIFFILIVLFLS